MVEEQPVSQRTRPSLSATLTRRQAMETRPGIRYHMAFHFISLGFTQTVKKNFHETPEKKNPKMSKQSLSRKMVIFVVR